MFEQDDNFVKVGKIETLVGFGTEIRGNILSRGTIRIEGKIEGEVISEDGVIVGETGAVKGDITGKNIMVGGRVVGDLSAQGRVELLPTAKLVGDVHTGKLIIADGVVFEGNCVMNKEFSATEKSGK